MWHPVDRRERCEFEWWTKTKGMPRFILASDILNVVKVNIARALYYDADVVIMDNPLSAGAQVTL
jgi:hypothetical protein